jgi:hypothetical protein
MALGSFGVDRPALEETFEYFGEVIRVHPDLTDLAFIDLTVTMATATSGNQAISALSSLSATVVHPDDLDRFVALAHAHRQTIGDITELTGAIVEALSKRPTVRPSASSDGSPATAPSSTDDSSSRALHRLEGRPDLQLTVIRRQEFEAAG